MVEKSFGWRGARARGSCLSLRGAVLAVLLAAAGCATVGGLTKDSSPEAKRVAVTGRAQGFWASMIDGDLERAYGFLSPASREIVKLETFKAKARTGYREAQVENIECEGAVCKVRLMIGYDTRQMRGLVTPLEQQWVIDEGQAWLVW
jgi:hypothetical protein